MSNLHKILLFMTCTMLSGMVLNAFGPGTYSRENEEIREFINKFGFNPFLYCFNDNDARNLHLEFLGKDVLKISNVPKKSRYSHLAFVDVYQIHCDTVFREQYPIYTYIVVDKLIYSNRQTHEPANEVLPFHSDPFLNTYSVFGNIECDTIRIVEPYNEAMWVNNAYFSIVRPHQLGAWTQNKELAKRIKKEYMQIIDLSAGVWDLHYDKKYKNHSERLYELIRRLK